MRAVIIRTVGTSFLCVLALTAASCGGGGGGTDLSSPSAPTNPQNTNLSGTWTGTLTRPAGLASIAVRWVATQNNGNVQAGEGNVNGPFTMTTNGVSVEAAVKGGFVGGSNTQGGMNFQIILNAGTSSTVPTCQVLSTATFTGFPPGATSLTSAPFEINYNSCQGFVAPTPPTNFTKETTVLSMTKQ